MQITNSGFHPLQFLNQNGPIAAPDLGQLPLPLQDQDLMMLLAMLGPMIDTAMPGSQGLGLLPSTPTFGGGPAVSPPSSGMSSFLGGSSGSAPSGGSSGYVPSSGSGTSAAASSSSSASNSAPVDVNQIQGGTEWGRKLAAEARSHATGSGGWCFKYVGESLRKFGVQTSGASAYMAGDQLAQSDKFREAKIDPKNFKKLPPGAVVVWDKGNGHPHGHISIALGDGKEASDVIRDQITDYGTSARVFLPKGAKKASTNPKPAPPPKSNPPKTPKATSPQPKKVSPAKPPTRST